MRCVVLNSAQGARPAADMNPVVIRLGMYTGQLDPCLLEAQGSVRYLPQSSSQRGKQGWVVLLLYGPGTSMGYAQPAPAPALRAPEAQRSTYRSPPFGECKSSMT